MTPEHFDEFFEELHKYPPFPWQSRLATQVCTTGEWPPELDLPTSAGKTAAIDIALFHLAYEAEKPPAERQAARRIIFVVDRRLIVDEAYDRAERIRKALDQALQSKDGILYRVAGKLLELAGAGGKPLQVERLRGGLPRERAFIRNPLQPAIILSTVDQIGSRMLFRGYGVSEFMRPIHAALVGVDSLILLDEAHLSRPFVDTLARIRCYQGEKWAEKPVAHPVGLVSMTATPTGEGEPFRLDEADLASPELAGRINSPKPAELIAFPGDKDDRQQAQRELALKLAESTRSLMAQVMESGQTTPVVGVVANRVMTARLAFEEIRKVAKGNGEDADALLLTGRIRPHERDELVKEYLHRMKAGREPDANPHPLYVVATQTIEVGADLDFDALATEAAPLDALRQRFGRLNRLGKRPWCKATILFDKNQPKDDPLYGKAIDKTWKWLGDHGRKERGHKTKRFDFGIIALKEILPTGDTLKKLLSLSGTAPVLMPAHLDLLTQTSPTPAYEPEIALYLHGPDSQPEDVQFVWRGDLPDRLDRNRQDEIVETVALLPPVQGEVLALPVWAAKALLARESADVADLEGRAERGRAEQENGPKRPPLTFVVRWRGQENSEIVSPKDIRPGDIIVVPASLGSLDRFGWNPNTKERVEDIAESVDRKRAGRPLQRMIRVHPGLIPDWFGKEADQDSSRELEVQRAQRHLADALKQLEEEDADIHEIGENLLDQLRGLNGLKPSLRERLRQLAETQRFDSMVYPAKKPQGFIFLDRSNQAIDFTDETDNSSLTREQPLQAHSEGVKRYADCYARGCGLTDLAGDIELSGHLHDLGKADPRFQAWLHNGDRTKARAARLSGKLLAKSAMNIHNVQALRAARQQARYPEGVRHECYSVALVENNPALLAVASDLELVRYLVGTHHGRGRPFMPAPDDPGTEIPTFSFDNKEISFSGKPGLEALDAEWTDLFWKLVGRYGYWGLAYLETLVRLADFRQSEEEMKGHG